MKGEETFSSTESEMKFRNVQWATCIFFVYALKKKKSLLFTQLHAGRDVKFRDKIDWNNITLILKWEPNYLCQYSVLETLGGTRSGLPWTRSGPPWTRSGPPQTRSGTTWTKTGSTPKYFFEISAQDFLPKILFEH